jgi:uncharacterized protein
MENASTPSMAGRLGQKVSASSLRRLIVRYPVAAYLIMAFTFAWGSLSPLLLSKSGLGLLPIDLSPQLFLPIASYLGLALPAFLMTAATGGRAAVKELLGRCLRWRVGVHWYFVALFGMLVISVLAALPFFGLLPLRMLVSKWELLFTVYLPGLLVPFLIVNLPEELGWTGYAQATLQERRGPVLASIIVSPFFALIHLPAYFVVGWLGDGSVTLPQALLTVGLIALLAIPLRLLLMWLHNGSGSVLLVGMLHSAFNMMTGQQIMPMLIPGADATTLNLLVLGAIAVAAVVVAAVTRGRFGYQSKP